MSTNPFNSGLELITEAAQARESDVHGATAKAYQALHLFEGIPTRRGIGFARLLLGDLALSTANLAESRDHLVTARDLFAEIPLRELEAQARQLLGEVLMRLDDYEAARVEFEAALRIFDREGKESGSAEIHRRLGSLERRCGNIDQAVREYNEAIWMFVKLGDQFGMAGVFLSCGNTLATIGEDSDAMEWYESSMQLFEQVGDRLGQANAERFFAAAGQRLGKTTQALAYYRKALEGYTEVGDVLGESYVRQALGEIATEAGDSESAREELRQSIELFGRTNDPVSLVEAVNTLADSYLKDDDELGAFHAMAWGAAEAREAARWAASSVRREHSNELVSALESRALELAVKLGEDAEAGRVIEGGAARLVGLFPILLNAPETSDPNVRSLRERIRQLAARLESKTFSDATETPGRAALDDTAGAAETPDDRALAKRTLFLSHSSQDLQFALDLVQHLQADGRCRVWMSETDIGVGRNYAAEIMRSLRDCDAVVVLLSRAALGSEHILREVGLALSVHRRLLPVTLEPGLLEPGDLPDDWRYFLHTVQAMRWTDPATVAAQILGPLEPKGLG